MNKIFYFILTLSLLLSCTGKNKKCLEYYDKYSNFDWTERDSVAKYLDLAYLCDTTNTLFIAAKLEQALQVKEYDQALNYSEKIYSIDENPIELHKQSAILLKIQDVQEANRRMSQSERRINNISLSGDIEGYSAACNKVLMDNYLYGADSAMNSLDACKELYLNKEIMFVNADLIDYIERLVINNNKQVALMKYYNLEP